MTELVSDQAIADARQRIAPHVLRTPLLASPALGESLGCELHLKAELLQHTGSFKVRGVFNKALSLNDDEKAGGVIAFSAGNHAMAVAHVGMNLGIAVTVCMPAAAVQLKIDAVQAMGASVELVDGDLVAHAMRRQQELGATLIHPFDDPAIVAGHASLGAEIIEDLPGIDTVIVPVGGGGLISGTATVLKRARPDIRVIGVEPDSADVVGRSRRAGEPVPLPGPRSLADGLAAPVTGVLNLAHIDAYVDQIVTVPEAAIRPAWQELVTIGKLAAEPAAAAGIAAIRTGAVAVAPEERVCLVISGGNADFGLLSGDPF